MRLFVGRAALVGEVGIDAAAIGRAGVAIDQAGFDHLVQAARGAAVSDALDAREVLEAQHRVGCLVQVGQDLVPAEVNARLGEHFLLDRDRHRGVGAGDAFP